MGVTRLRWALGGALAMVSLLAAMRAVSTYAAHGLWLGTASVVLLGAIDLGDLHLGHLPSRTLPGTVAQTRRFSTGAEAGLRVESADGPRL